MLAGRHNFEAQEILGQIEQILGPVSEERKWQVIAHTQATAMPSEYEGFGIPIYESYAVNTTVMMADNSSTTELALRAEEFESMLDWPHFQPQISFICDAQGTLLVDALTTFEGMDQGMSKIGAPWGKTWSVQTKASSADLDNTAATQFVETYYTHDLRLWKTSTAQRTTIALWRDATG